MECLPILLVFATGRSFFASPNLLAASSAARLTKVAELSVIERPYAPNMGREYSGCGAGKEPLGSPMIAAAVVPLFRTISGFTPKNAGFHTQRSASFPASIDPT